METSLRSTLLARCRDEFVTALNTAVAETGLRSPTLRETLRNEAQRVFDELAGLRSQEEFKRLRSITASRISLVHPEDMDLTVEMINLSHDLTDACERELPRLHLLFMSLLGQDSSVVDQLPVGPEAVCITLRAVCDSGELSGEARIDFPSRVKQAMIICLRSLYGHLTEILQSEGLEPFSLVHHSAEQTSAYSSPERLPGYGQGYDNGTAAPAAAPVLTLPASAEPLDRLQNTLLRRHSRGSSPVTQPALDPDLLNSIMERVLLWINERQQAAAALDYGVPQTNPNFSELGGLLPAEKNATIDAISITLDVLQADRTLCPAIKPSLERLRLPLCKLALMAPELLGNAHDPARELLNSLLRLAYSVTPASSEDHPVIRAVEDACRHIQQHFNQDKTIFASSGQMTDACFEARVASCRNRCNGALHHAELEAKREHSRSRAARAIRALSAGDTPAPIKDFLEQLWVRVLAAIHQHAGEKSEPWLRALSTANQLVESVQPKTDPQARKQLVAGLPALLQQLRAGLDAIGTPDSLRERAFQGFVDCHTAVILGRSPKPVKSEILDVSVTARIDDFTHEVPGLHIVRMPPEGEAERNIPDWIIALGANHWITLNLPEEPARILCITWVEGSPRMFLAADPDSEFILVFPQRWLCQLAAEGSAAECRLEGNFDRAAEEAIRNYHG